MEIQKQMGTLSDMNLNKNIEKIVVIKSSADHECFASYCFYEFLRKLFLTNCHLLFFRQVYLYPTIKMVQFFSGHYS